MYSAQSQSRARNETRGWHSTPADEESNIEHPTQNVQQPAKPSSPLPRPRTRHTRMRRPPGGGGIQGGAGGRKAPRICALPPPGERFREERRAEQTQGRGRLGGGRRDLPSDAPTLRPQQPVRPGGCNPPALRARRPRAVTSRRFGSLREDSDRKSRRRPSACAGATHPSGAPSPSHGSRPAPTDPASVGRKSTTSTMSTGIAHRPRVGGAKASRAARGERGAQ